MLAPRPPDPHGSIYRIEAHFHSMNLRSISLPFKTGLSSCFWLTLGFLTRLSARAGGASDSLDINCPYCGSPLNSTLNEWIVTGFMGIEEYARANSSGRS